MEDFFSNSSPRDKSNDYSNITSNYQNYSKTTSDNNNYSNTTSDNKNSSNSTSDYYRNIIFETYEFNGGVASIMNVGTYIIICIGLPLTLLAIYGHYSLVRSDHVAPIYVINLLITDLIQLCCMIVQVVPLKDLKIADIFIDIYLSALMASVGFMVCIALERYLVIACPMWYRFKRTIKFSVVVCIVVWTLPLFFFFIFLFEVNPKVPQTVSGIFLLLPFPLLIFFLVGTLKTLSASISVPCDEKRRIVGILVLVLLNYTLLFMPSIIGYLSNEARNNITFRHLYVIFVRLNPLADLVLYVFMRKGAIDKLLASVCCCRMDSNEISSPSV
ncbi:G-protein coupled receptor 4-like [Micropterus dolomieu]|uniref:G-protein coupled receptor 4-like n=1 Tax=Micropterus dolomieu TaxID=147949 RepID=UPI001E8EC2DF|nr:G-protein coupled receptor 4-like [Micropterus dolomieu]